jgi:hypothetical protein
MKLLLLGLRDVDLPASFVQKYLVQKLNLSSEAEVCSFITLSD